MLIDSNILIYSLNKASPQHKTAQAFLQSLDKRIFAQQNIFETLRVLTHPKFPNPYPPHTALEAVSAISDHACIIAPTFETTYVATELVRKYNIAGTEIFDAYLVATALTNGLKKIATDNVRHLGKYEEVEVVNPFS